MASSEDALQTRTTAESWYNAATKMTTDTVSFHWKIKNFLGSSTKTGDCRKSVVFHMNDDGETSWRLFIYPAGTNEIYAGYVSLYLKVEDTKEHGKFTVERKFCILDRSNKKIKICEGDAPYKMGTNWGASRFIKRKILMEKNDDLLPDDTLTIFCKIRLNSDSERSQQVLFHKPKVFHKSISVGYFFNNPLFSDITLDINGKEIFAHKIILSAQSPKFSAMFCSGTKGNDQKRVEVTDVPYEVMKDILNFIYTGETPSFRTPPYDLLDAAKSYGLVKLQEICEERLASNRPV